MRFRLLLPSEREPHLSEGDFSLSRRFRGLAACAFALAGGFSFQRASPLVSARPLRPSHHLRHFMLFNANQSRQHQQTRQNTLARTPSITRKHAKCAETDALTRHARKMVLTRNRHGAHAHARQRTRGAHTSARHARQRTHTHTPARTSACTHTHAHPRAHTHTRTRTHPRTRRGPRARAHARPRTGGTSRAAPSAMQTRPL